MPIAIVGIGGRFPGDAANPEKLWELLCQGRSALSEVPKDRFNIDAFYHPHAERAGTQNFRGAHFMNRAPEAFDAPFFSITPNEAKAMDPQQRMCLEVAYEAMENGKANWLFYLCVRFTKMIDLQRGSGWKTWSVRIRPATSVASHRTTTI